jgi:nucleotide-binding universal stress UspA family protein
MQGIKNILVPVDFSEASIAAAHFAASLAQAYQAKLYVLRVKAPFPVHGRIAAGSFEDIQKHRMIKEQTELSGVIPAPFKNSIPVEEIHVTGMPVYRVIVEKARELSVDVIVIPSPDRRGWARVFKKNTSAKVMRYAPCSVLGVRSSEGQTKV